MPILFKTDDERAQWAEMVKRSLLEKRGFVESSGEADAFIEALRERSVDKEIRPSARPPEGSAPPRLVADAVTLLHDYEAAMTKADAKLDRKAGTRPASAIVAELEALVAQKAKNLNG